MKMNLNKGHSELDQVAVSASTYRNSSQNKTFKNAGKVVYKRMLFLDRSPSFQQQSR